MFIETLESRDLFSTTIGPVSFQVSNDVVNLSGSGSIVMDSSSITLSGSISGTVGSQTISTGGTLTLQK